MKLKIGVYLTDDVAKLLKRAVKQSGATKSDIVNEALARFLAPAPENDPAEAVLHRLVGLAKAIRHLQRDVEIVAETLALHIRQFLMITPPVLESEQQEAEKLGRERYAFFIAQIAKRINSDRGLVSEVMDRIAQTRPGMVNSAMPPDASQPLEAASHG